MLCIPLAAAAAAVGGQCVLPACLTHGSPTLPLQVARMCQAQRRQLLAFVTSSSALPAGGFAALRGFNGALHPFTGGLLGRVVKL